MPPVVLGETLIVSALIGLFSAMVPASSAARRNIVDALRTVAIRWNLTPNPFPRGKGNNCVGVRTEAGWRYR